MFQLETRSTQENRVAYVYSILPCPLYSFAIRSNPYLLYFPSKIKNCHECFLTVCLPAVLAHALASSSVTLGTTFSGLSNEF